MWDPLHAAAGWAAQAAAAAARCHASYHDSTAMIAEIFYSRANWLILGSFVLAMTVRCKPLRCYPDPNILRRIPYKNETLGHENHLLNHSSL
jgi:hypothetical protein